MRTKYQKIAIGLSALALCAGPAMADGIPGPMPRIGPHAPPKIVVRLVDAKCVAALYSGEAASCTDALNYIQWPEERRANLGIEVRVQSGERYFMSSEGNWDLVPANAERLTVHVRSLRLRPSGPNPPPPISHAAEGTCTVMQSADQTLMKSVACDARADGKQFKIRLGSGQAKIL